MIIVDIEEYLKKYETEFERYGIYVDVRDVFDYKRMMNLGCELVVSRGENSVVGELPPYPSSSKIDSTLYKAAHELQSNEISNLLKVMTYCNSDITTWDTQSGITYTRVNIKIENDNYDRMFALMPYLKLIREVRMFVDTIEKRRFYTPDISKYVDMVRSLPWQTTKSKPDNTDLYESIDQVIFNGPATIVMWKDGTKTVVKCGDGDVYDREKGLAMCIAKKALGNKGNYYNVFKEWLPGLYKEIKDAYDREEDDLK